MLRSLPDNQHPVIPDVAATLQFTGPLCVSSLVLMGGDGDWSEWLKGVPDSAPVSIEWTNISMVMKASAARALLENVELEK